MPGTTRNVCTSETSWRTITTPVPTFCLWHRYLFMSLNLSPPMSFMISFLSTESRLPLARMESYIFTCNGWTLLRRRFSFRGWMKSVSTRAVPILKKRRTQNHMSNFRPISLLYMFSKLVNSRTTTFSPAAPSPIRSTDLPPSASTSFVYTSLSRETKKHVLGLSIDISKAYETVDLSLWMNVISDMKLPPDTILWT